MCDNKKTAPVLRPPEQQMEIKGFSDPFSSENNYNIQGGPISRFLSPGRQNAVPLKHLEVMTGWDNRTIRRTIEDERRAGVPILSDNANGYFIASSEVEKARCVRSLRHRASEILKTAGCIEQAAIRDGG